MTNLASGSQPHGVAARVIVPDRPEDEEEDLRPQDLRQLARFLWPFMRAYKRQLAVIGLLLLVQTGFNAAFPLATKYLIDEGLVEKDWNALIFVLSFFAVGAVAVSLVAIGNDYICSRVFANVVKDIRVTLFEHVQRLPMPFFQRMPSGNILSRFSGDVVATETMLVHLVPSLVLPILEVIYATALMFYFNFWLGLIGLLIFPMILIGPRIFSKLAFELSYEKRSREAALLSASQENIQAQSVVKAFGLRDRAVRRFRKVNEGWLRYAFRMNFFAALAESSAHMGVYLVHIVIIGLGAYWAYTDVITIGTLVAFEGMFVSMGYALTDLTQFVPTLAQASGSVQHLDEVFKEQPSLTDAPGAQPLARLEREIAFENITFNYPGGKTALADANFTVRKNAYVAIVGRSGSGKSTILNLLLRFYDPSTGRVTFDGVDIRTVTQDSLRAQMGIVFQDSFLFDASILDNIRMGKPDATLDEVEAALRAAEVWDLIQSLPDGVNTSVGERGGRLSGGQRQRISIARALVRSPAVLILDEATSALDAIAEQAVNVTLRRISDARTVINVTHRLSNVVGADHILVIDDGRIVEAGSHLDLLVKDGYYATLWRTQQQDGGPRKREPEPETETEPA
jgi:ATP-binding cassette, subfamily B, bacterial